MKPHNNMRIAAIIWLGVIVMLSITAWRKHPSIDTSMMSLLPASQQAPLVGEASRKIGRQFSQRMLLVISGADESTLRPAVKQVANQFATLPVVGSVLWRIQPSDIEASNTALQPYRYVLLANSLRDKLAAGDTSFVRQQAISQLLNPVSIGKNDLVNDPFFLGEQWQRSQTPKLAIHIDNSLLRLDNSEKVSYLVLLNLSQDAFKRSTQQLVLNQLDQLKQQLAPQDINIVASGLVVHADAGTSQAEHEISTIGVGSFIGVMVIFIIVFGNLRQIPILFTPIIVGCIVASASLFILFDQVHIVTFSFGAGLIGVSIDYVLHFMCERQLRQNVIQHLWPSLLLGLCTSVAAYSAQAITPFPGLRQMALFSIFGLIGAWLTVILWMPIMTKNMRTKPIPAIRKIESLLRIMPSIDSHQQLMTVLSLVTIIAICMIASGKTVDDLRLLQTSPPALIAQDANIQKQLQLANASQFLLLPCQNLQACLMQEEAIKPALSALVKQGALDRYNLVSDVLPSLSQQSSNSKLVSHLYAKELNQLFDTIQAPPTLLTQAKQSMQLDIAQRLTVAQLPSNPQLQSIEDKIINTKAHGVATIINLKSNPSIQLEQSLNGLLHQFPNLLLVDQVDSISNLMKSYRHQMMQWCGLAYVCIFVLFTIRYKRKALRMIAPPLLASLVTTAIIMHTTAGINLFHMLALMLVLGIGMDMGIFLSETNQAPQTWLAVTLSIITSLLAFGLLFLSKTPVLSHFGITLLLGLTLVWLISVLVRPLNNKKEN